MEVGSIASVDDDRGMTGTIKSNSGSTVSFDRANHQHPRAVHCRTSNSPQHIFFIPPSIDRPMRNLPPQIGEIVVFEAQPDGEKKRRKASPWGYLEELRLSERKMPKVSIRHLTK